MDTPVTSSMTRQAPDAQDDEDLPSYSIGMLQ